MGRDLIIFGLAKLNVNLRVFQNAFFDYLRLVQKSEYILDKHKTFLHCVLYVGQVVQSVACFTKHVGQLYRFSETFVLKCLINVEQTLQQIGQNLCCFMYASRINEHIFSILSQIYRFIWQFRVRKILAMAIFFWGPWQWY